MRTDWGGASMGFAKHIEGYEESVDKMISLRKDGKYIPSGDPVKAAKAIFDLSGNPEPPLHLILGSDAVGILRKANAARDAEFEKWIDISNSIDHDDSKKTHSQEVPKFI